MSKIKSVAISLAESHVDIEPDIELVFWFPAASESEDEIRLIEVSGSAIPSGTVHPVPFAPTSDVPYRTLVADVTLEEWDKICNGEIELPQGWSLEAKEDLTPGRS